ncbi:hypothetical protein [Angelakisella massiliensis]|uniref:hypothetical protein n=1 Tax=Angelakisella massiliensis TaxID=1871018 RepID=UPI0024B22361|nr:hypothetical protein [Angelakisella massiliensis]
MKKHKKKINQKKAGQTPASVCGKLVFAKSVQNHKIGSDTVSLSHHPHAQERQHKGECRD